MKSKFNFRKLIFVVFFIFLIYIISMTYIIQHETIHYKIFERYGIESKITISWLVSGEVNPNPADYVKCTEICKLSQALVDIVSYSIALLIMSAFFIYSLYLIRGILWKKEGV